MNKASEIFLSWRRAANPTQETNGVVEDFHYSETGHIELAKTMKELLNNSKKK